MNPPELVIKGNQGYLLKSRWFQPALTDLVALPNNAPRGGLIPASTQTPGSIVPGQYGMSEFQSTTGTLPNTNEELCAMKHMINVRQGGRGKSWGIKELKTLTERFGVRQSTSSLSKKDLVNILCQFVDAKCKTGCSPEQLRK